MLKAKVIRNVYGFRDSEILGPVNFITTDDKTMLMIQDDSYGYDHIVWIGEMNTAPTVEKKLFSLAKKAGYTTKEITRVTQHGGSFCR